ncbi:required for meiotic nuclear division protein 1 homolog isoform X2 [Amphibalanus amphitrite]|uniref:required for meiotic nuclear division protein 1 homolog isoform X2 n=1 Tax=Amphibalanus amphitrite TaxID=1232801 RepID=UPI001C901718|nr:required for meiotic nuclear division protein 1 homolog isoform X2 [Amphibalanus amphitrite]XP_043226950.1 required for meiotic nuclear division protein 1 homolog isoform X2 [Amphibalanus amphitrite]
MSMRRLLSVTASLARVVPAARTVSSRLSPAVRCLPLAARPSAVQTAIGRFGSAAPLSTSAAAAAARTEPPPPPASDSEGKKAIELDLSAVHSKRRVQRKRAVVKNDTETRQQPSAEELLVRDRTRANALPGEAHVSHVFSSELDIPSCPPSYQKVSPSKTRKRHKDMEVVAYSTAEEYNLESLMEGLREQNLYHPSAMSEDVHDVLHVAARYTLGAEPREIYLFREGTVVFWNVPELERRSVLEFIRQFQEGSYDQETVEEESDSMPYSYTEVFNKTRLVNGRILLNMEGSTDLEKYAFSNAMALSVKLGIWESALERYIDSIRFVTDELKKGGRISMKKEEVLKKNGELFGLRHLINLSSDCLDTPDFYWDKDNLESLYQKTCNHLNIAKRTRVMNEKLNHCVELADMLTTNLADQHHVRLEWMIIALIMVEVGFEVIHFLERYT